MFGQIAELLFGCAGFIQDVIAGYADFPLGGGEIAADHLHRGRFAGTIGAEKSEDFTCIQAEAQLVDCTSILWT